MVTFPPFVGPLFIYWRLLKREPSSKVDPKILIDQDELENCLGRPYRKDSWVGMRRMSTQPYTPTSTEVLEDQNVEQELGFKTRVCRDELNLEGLKGCESCRTVGVLISLIHDPPRKDTFREKVSRGWDGGESVRDLYTSTVKEGVSSWSRTIRQFV